MNNIDLSDRTELLISDYKDPQPEKAPDYENLQLKLVRLAFKTLGVVMPTKSAAMAYQIFATPRMRAKHRKSDALLESAKVSEVPFKKIKLRLYEWGDSDAERTVLLLHGWESRGTALRMFAPDLVAVGYRVVALDAPAHGDSEGERTNFRNNSEAISTIIQHLGGVYGVIGHSFGCSSLLFAMQFTNPNLRIERVVFVALPLPVSYIIENFFRLIDAPLRMQGKFKRLIEKIAKHKIHEFDFSASQQKIQIGKVLLLHDKQDLVTPHSSAERFLAGWTNAKLLLTDGYGHYNLVRNPDVVQRVTNFLTE